MNKGKELSLIRCALLAKYATTRGEVDPVEACKRRAALRQYRKERDATRKAMRRKGVQYNRWKAAQRRVDNNA